MGNYVSLQDRHKSFDDAQGIWGVSRPGIEELVASGFYMPLEQLKAPNSVDTVQCFCCAVRVAHWKKGDNVDIVHAKYSPKCAYLLYRRGAKWIKHVTGYAHPFVTTQVLEIDDLNKEREKGLRPLVESRATQLQLQNAVNSMRCPSVVEEEFKFRPALNPRHKASRLESVRCCTMLDSYFGPEDFADAGFRWMGEATKMKCTYCFFRYSKWERNDDPWRIHAQGNPDCCHLILMLGKENIEKIRSSEIIQVQERSINAGKDNCRACGKLVPAYARIHCVQTGMCCCDRIVYDETLRNG